MDSQGRESSLSAGSSSSSRPVIQPQLVLSHIRYHPLIACVSLSLLPGFARSFLRMPSFSWISTQIPLATTADIIFFRLPVFGDPLFHQYRLDLRQSITNSISPHSLKLSTVTPRISHDIRSVTHMMATIMERINRRFNNVETTLTDTQSVWLNLLSDSVGRQLQEHEQRMLQVFDFLQKTVTTFGYIFRPGRHGHWDRRFISASIDDPTTG